jgi:gluconate 2-dehydrogenase gamma chain
LSSSPSTSRREFIKYGVVTAVGFGVASAVEIPILNNALQTTNESLKQKNDQISQLQAEIQKTPILQKQVTSIQALRVLNGDEASELEAIIETIIPTDVSGPGGKEAGVLYFIDHQLSSTYGNNSRMYMQEPFEASGQTGTLTVDNITYPKGTIACPFSGPTYQYNMLLRDFWKTGLSALQKYANTAYGRNFEDLGGTQQNQALGDLYNNTPTSFSNITPQDFFNELLFMTWSGYLMDPLYGGNQQMVGWNYTAFSGVNMGNAHGEGLNPTQLMVAITPTRLQPISLGQYQKGLGLIEGK